MTASVFTFRLVSFSGDATGWIVYERIDFRGRLMRVTLTAPMECTHHRGDELIFETSMVRTKVIFDRVSRETLFLILPDDQDETLRSLRDQFRNKA
jgi:hypothetical protein